MGEMKGATYHGPAGAVPESTRFAIGKTAEPS